jgi:hypothetical protein
MSMVQSAFAARRAANRQGQGTQTVPRANLENFNKDTEEVNSSKKRKLKGDLPDEHANISYKLGNSSATSSKDDKTPREHDGEQTALKSSHGQFLPFSTGNALIGSSRVPTEISENLSRFPTNQKLTIEEIRNGIKIQMASEQVLNLII